MTINHTLDGEKLSVELEGRLDTTTSPSLEALLTENRPVSEVVFDFSKLEYISSAGLRVLLSEQKYVNSVSGKMIIRNVNEMVMEVFEITGFVDLLTIE